MLGEGARTEEAAEQYFAAYDARHRGDWPRAGKRPLPARPGISVKFSALHPRYEAISRRRVLDELVPRLRSWRGMRAGSISISPSTRRKPTGWNCRSR